MQCPRCYSHSLQIKNGTKLCSQDGCVYVSDLHPISYDNDVMNYQDGEEKKDRISGNYSENNEDQTTFDIYFRRGRKIIVNSCYLMGKLNHQITQLSVARFRAVLQVIGKEESEQGKVFQKKNLKMYVKELAHYCIYSVCFQKEIFNQEFNICKLLGCKIKDLKELINKLNSRLRGKINYIPQVKPQHLLKTVCIKRGIRNQQKNAMFQMSERICKLAGLDCRKSTIAALCFWKICQYSTLYSNSFSLSEICKNHDDLQLEGISSKQILKYFDITPSTVSTTFKNKIQTHFMTTYLPMWQGRNMNKDETRK